MGKGLWRAGPEAERSTCEDIGALRSRLSREAVSSDTYASLLRLCGERRAISEALLLHARIILHGVRQHELSFLQNLLIQTYGRCNAVDDAFSTFSHINGKDHFSWNLLLGACCENAQSLEVLQVFNQMQTEGFLPNKHAFQSLLTMCAAQSSVWRCKATHTCIYASSYASDVVLGSAIVNMYGKCSSVKDARHIFDNMSQRNVFSWNALMSTHAQHGQGQDALLLFQEMMQNDIAPSRVTFVCLLDACATLTSLDTTKLLHFCVTDAGFDSDIVIGTTLIKLYGKCGFLEEALNVFNKVPGKGIITWNTMIDVSASHGQDQQAFYLFNAMLGLAVEADSRTFVSVLTACANEENLVAGKLVHFIVMSSGVACDLVLDTALISMYGKCGSLRNAQAVYNHIPTHDFVLWKTMMAAYIQLGQERDAIEFIEKMPPCASLDSFTFIRIFEMCATNGSLEAGRMMHALFLDSELALDVSIGTSVVNMYGKCGAPEDAQASFQLLIKPDIVAWNAMIAGYSQCGQFEAIVDLLFHMVRQGIVPNKISFKCILSSLSLVGRVIDAAFCFYAMKASFGILAAIAHFNTMLDLFGRAGWVVECKILILSMPFQPTTTSWMTLLNACRIYLNLAGEEWAVRHVYEIESDFSASWRVSSDHQHGF